MKKLIATISIALAIITLTSCTSKETYDEISYNELTKITANKKDFILFIGSNTCTPCSSYKITINKIIKKYNIDIKYIDISKLSEKEKSELQSNFVFNGTPTTIFVTKGKEKDTHNRINGNQKYSKVIEKLKENGYIKE